MVSGILWGSWNTSPADKEARLRRLPAALGRHHRSLAWLPSTVAHGPQGPPHLGGRVTRAPAVGPCTRHLSQVTGGYPNGTNSLLGEAVLDTDPQQSPVGLWWTGTPAASNSGLRIRLLKSRRCLDERAAARRSQKAGSAAPHPAPHHCSGQERPHHHLELGRRRSAASSTPGRDNPTEDNPEGPLPKEGQEQTPWRQGASPEGKRSERSQDK